MGVLTDGRADSIQNVKKKAYAMYALTYFPWTWVMAGLPDKYQDRDKDLHPGLDYAQAERLAIQNEGVRYGSP